MIRGSDIKRGLTVKRAPDTQRGPDIQKGHIMFRDTRPSETMSYTDGDKLTSQRKDTCIVWYVTSSAHSAGATILCRLVPRFLKGSRSWVR